MKYLFILLFPLLALQACHKTDTKRIIFPYNQLYVVEYFKANDSLYINAEFDNGQTPLMQLKDDESITVNGVAPNLPSTDRQYDWSFNGLHDLEFNLIKDGSAIRNKLSAIDVKAYDFIDVPDTMSLSKVYQVKWKGPGNTSTENLYFNLIFSNKYYVDTRLEAQSDDSIALSFPYFSNTSTGEAIISLTWSKEFRLQHIDADGDGAGSGSIMCATRIEKKIWIIP